MLVATTVAATFAWKNVEAGPVSTVICWYCALLFSIIAVTAAVQQSNVLYKVTVFPDGCHRVRKLLRSSRLKCDETYRVDLFAHYIWQTPIMLLNFSIDLFVLGLLIIVFDQPLISNIENRSHQHAVRDTPPSLQQPIRRHAKANRLISYCA